MICRYAAICLALAGAMSCRTVAPFQTASTVDPGRYRAGVQLTSGAWCGTGFPPVSCLGLGLPLPEIRAAGRMGIAARVDAGVSIHGQLSLAQFVNSRVGALVDGKVELWSAPTEDGRHVISAAIGLGSEYSRVAGQDTTPGVADIQFFVPVFYGYQFGGTEFVASPRFQERLAFIDVDGDGRANVLEDSRMGLAVGFVFAGSPRFAIGIDFLAPTQDWASGEGNITLGIWWDFK